LSSTKTESRLNQMEEKLLNTLIDKGLRETKPRRRDTMILYTGLEELTDQINEVEMRKLLRSLTAKGYMAEKNYDSAILCPNCASLKVYSKYSCPNCQSNYVSKVQLLEHITCGYMGSNAEFEKEDVLACPKCRTVIAETKESNVGALESGNIRIIGSSFVCDKCGSKFEKPLTTHFCDKCGSSFTYKEAVYLKLPAYELTEKVEALAPKRYVTETLRRVENALTAKGFKVELDARVKGKSGVEQRFDLTASKDQKLMLLDASAWGNQGDLISLLGKKTDVDANLIVLIDLYGSPNLASLGKPYKIAVIDGRDEKYIGVLSNLVDEMLKEEPEKRTSHLKRWLPR